MIAIDFETKRISENFPFPHPICLSWATKDDRGILKPEQIARFLQKIPPDKIIIAHNLKFELMVINEWVLGMSSWVHERLNSGTLRDTMISAKLFDLGATGDLSSHKYSLAALVKRYFGPDITESKAKWQTKFEDLNNIPIAQWPKGAVDYAIEDSVWALKLFNIFSEHDCQDSIRADYVLAKATRRGFKVDQRRVSVMASNVIKETEGAKHTLVSSEFAKIDPKTGKIMKSLIKLREHIKKLTPRGFEAPLTDKGAIATDRSVLLRHSKQDDVCAAFLKISEFTKLENTYLPALKGSTVRANYNVLVETGRTSSFGSTLYPSCNLQNFPRGMGVRECLIPRDGHVFVSIDYGSLELCSVAQQIFNTYGHSIHARQLNQGQHPTDLHSFLGATIYNEYLKPEIPITYDVFVKRLNDGDKEIKNFRTLAKPVGLGFPGGLGPRTMVEFAAQTYGIKLTIEEATKLKSIFYNTYPDFSNFMHKESKKFKTGNRERVGKTATYIDEYAYKINNRVRTGCNFTNFANGYLMQSLSADGAKRALWRVHEYLRAQKTIGAIVNFIHDEIIFELRDNDAMAGHVEALSYVMARAMQELMPNIRITVEASIMERNWSKDGPFRAVQKYWVDGDLKCIQAAAA